MKAHGLAGGCATTRCTTVIESNVWKLRRRSRSPRQQGPLQGRGPSPWLAVVTAEPSDVWRHHVVTWRKVMSNRLDSFCGLR